MGALHVAMVSLALGGTGETVLLDFTASWCGPCQQMNPVVAQLSSAGYPIRKINIDQHRDLAARYQVSNIPCFVMLVDGREVARKVGAATPGELKQMLSQAQQTLKVPGEVVPTSKTVTRDQSLDHIRPYPISSGSPHVSIAGCRAFDPYAEARQAAAAQAAQQAPRQPAPQPQVLPAAQPKPPAAQQVVMPARNEAVPPRRTPAAPARAPQRPAARPSVSRDFVNQALAASVRLKIEDTGGHSWGSGTVIDSFDDEALILTCGHIFRASNGRGRITVDGFGPGAPRGMTGELIHYDLKRDVALLSVATSRKLPAISVAPPGFKLKPGHDVVAIGCGGGRDPSVQQSRVNSLNKYVGPANVQVAGQPVQGRSGGGLFSDGYLVGVCYAADPQDNEGLYAALPSVYALLDEQRLSDIYQPRKPQQDVQVAQTRPARPPVPRANPATVAPQRIRNVAALNASVPSGRGPLSRAPLAASVPRMGEAPPPGQMGTLGDGSTARVMPASLSGQPAVFQANGSVANLSASERATLAELKRRTAYSEVICVIRRLDDPQGKSEVIVLDRASPDFVRQLVNEPTPPSGRLTSFEVHRPIRPASQH